jgi:prophage tail gpP-like protein
VTATGAGVELRGFSKTFRLSVSHPKEQREFLESSLDEISNTLARPFGLVVKYDSSLSAELQEKFSDEKIKAQEIVYGFLQNLARQRSVLMSDDVFGNIQYLKTNVGQAPVGSIVEGEDAIFPSAEQFKAVFDDSQIRQNYYSVSNNNLSFAASEPVGVAKNTNIKIPSFKAISVDSLVAGAGQKTVDFTRNYDLAASIQLPMEVNGWLAPNDALWRENTFVTLTSDSLFMPNGFNLLIRQAQYNLDSQGGEKTILSIIPPSLYAGGDIAEPW